MRRAPAGVLLATALCAPTPAHAHLVDSGLGPFYDGAIHLLLTPMDLVGLVTLGIFSGLQGAGAGRLVVVIAPIAWLCGGAAGLLAPMSGSFALLNAAALVLLGGSIALGLTVPRPVVGVVAAASGGLLGYQGGLELQVAGADWVALSGAVSVVVIVSVLTTALVVSVTAFAFRVALRVLGSWVAATGLLSIGWLAASRV